ncbi:hypothetical protein G9A89_018936 [Geosiphon pyriformis]|nr:hypothetical protein G9A89_018936 [Geosiphon pyriformis]
MNNYFLDQNIQNAFYTFHEYWIKNYLNATLTIRKQTTITDNSGTHTVIRPKKTTTRRERIGGKMDKYLLESITAAILSPSSIIGKTIQEILPIDKNLSYRRQLELYGHLGEIIEDMKLIKKTISEIQVEILGIIRLNVPRVLTIARRARTLIQRFGLLDTKLILPQVLYTLSTKDFNKLVSFDGSSISIAKKGESHRYLDIFLSIKGLSKPSLAKAHSDVRFFTNLVLKKAILDKQFSYLVSSILHPIVCYRTQFSFVLLSVCNKHSALFSSFSYVVDNLGLLNILKSSQFDMVHNNLFGVEANSLSVYTNGSVAGLGTTGMKAGAAAFFENVGMSLGIEVSGLVSLTLVEFQAVLDACKSELVLMHPDFCNCCWIERHHIKNIIWTKNLNVVWCKVKGHSGVLGNNVVDVLANSASSSECFFPPCFKEHFILADSCVVSDNARHFARDIFWSIYHAHWEVGSGLRNVADNLLADIDWYRSSFVWHPDLHMAAGFISKHTAGACLYFMKALHYWLPVAVHKCLYDKCYPSVVCLFCDDVEISDYVFICISDMAVRARLLDFHAAI